MFWGPVLDPNTCILGILGGHSGTLQYLWGHFGDPRTAGLPRRLQRRPFEAIDVFLLVVGGFGVSLGNHFGVMLVTFPSFVVSKWEVRLRTSFCLFLVRTSNPRA